MKQSIVNMFRELLRLNGPNYKAVAWLSEQDQKDRYKTAAKVITENDPEVLDIGCGVASLYDWFIENKYQPKYRGIDIVPEFVKICQEKGLEVYEQNALMISEKYDYIFIIGSLHYTYFDYTRERMFQLIPQILNHLFKYTKKVLVFTLLWTNPEALHIFTRQEVLDILKQIPVQKFELISRRNITKYGQGDEWLVYLYR